MLDKGVGRSSAHQHCQGRHAPVTGHVVWGRIRFATLEPNDLQRGWESRPEVCLRCPAGQFFASRTGRSVSSFSGSTRPLEHQTNTLDERSTVQMALLQRISADLERTRRASFIGPYVFNVSDQRCKLHCVQKSASAFPPK